eukprot:symbB.v1.2.038446.t1/scaffold5913.1/size22488/1
MPWPVGALVILLCHVLCKDILKLVAKVAASMVEELALLSQEAAGHRGREASEKARRLQQWFWAEVEAVEKRMSKEERLRWISKLVLGRMESSPFGDMIEDLRRRMDEKLVELGEDPKRRSMDRETPINFRRVQAWAKVVQDEDHRFLHGLMSKGVPLGVRGEIPFLPQVYDKKAKEEKEEDFHGWDEQEDGFSHRSNYGSAISHIEKVEAIVLSEVKKGWIQKITKKEAEEKFGRDLQLASLGAVPKDPAWEEVRVVHDATHGISVNTEIRQPNKMPFPQFDDVEAVVRTLREERPSRRMLIAFDIKSAHRLIPVQEEDWGLQSFRLGKEEEVYVNQVGTFGVASAAFWQIISLFLYLDLMEVPLAWKKTRGGFQAEWIGYQVDLESWKLGVSEKEGEGDQDGITVGGWEVFGAKGPEDARWFSVKVTRKSCPWLYLKGEPFRTIAAAELLAVTLAVMVFKEAAAWRNCEGRFSISGFTDNAGNTFVVNKFLSTKFPLSIVLMELAYQMAGLNATLSLSWIPREQNEEADDLTKNRFEKFDPGKRIEVNLEEIGFKVIPVLAEVAGRLDEEIKMRKAYNQMAKPQVTEIGTPTGTPLSDVSPTTLMPAPRLLTAGMKCRYEPTSSNKFSFIPATVQGFNDMDNIL